MAKILLVDDDKIVHDVLTAVLTGQGHAVTSALSGADGVAKAKEVMPDLLVLDFEMPGLGGEGVFERLRELGLTADIPILFLSSLPLSRQVGRVEVSRRVRFLRKPAPPADFLLAVNDLLSGK